MSPLIKHRLSRNISYLFFIQIANYAFPLVTIPYLTVVLGLKGYGIYTSLQLISVYAIAVVDYGFNVTGVRKVAQKNEIENAQVFSDITAARIFLSSIGTIIFMLLVIFLPQFEIFNYEDYILLLISILFLLIGNALTPIWFYQGVQNMKTGALIIFFGRLFGNIIILLFVKKTSDYILAFVCQAIMYFISGIIGFLAICRSISFKKPIFRGIWLELKDGWSLFNTSILGIFISSAGTLMLGGITSVSTAGGYSAIERLVKAILSLASPLTQATLPRISAAYYVSSNNGWLEWRKFFRLTALLAVIFTIMLFLFYYAQIPRLIFGSQYDEFASIIIYLSPWVLFSIMNNIIGIQLFSNIGEQKYYAICFIICSILYIILCYVLTRYLGFNGTAISLLVSEVILFFLLGRKLIEYWRINEESRDNF